MIPYICHIYGPIYANSYGIAILIGVLTFIYLASKDIILKKFISKNELIDVVLLETLVGIVGGAALHAINNWPSYESWIDLFKVWNGGFSILGTIIAVSITAPIYLKYKKIPILIFLDRVAIYAPLTQSIARIGCFFAGCCYGARTEIFWGVEYSHPDSAAPLFTKIHPTQIYSSLILLFIFFILYFFLQKVMSKKGQLLSIYLILSPAERFFVDFLRDDREFGKWRFLSINQIIALIIMLVGFILFIYYSFYNKKNYKHKNHEHI